MITLGSKTEKVKNKFDETDVYEVSELTENVLKQVAGGSPYRREYYKTPGEVQFIHKVGDIVEVENWFGFGTVRCKICEIKAEYRSLDNSGAPGMGGTSCHRDGYVDLYRCEELESHWYFSNGWYSRDGLEK